MATLTKDKVGIFHYILTDDQGTVIDQSTDSPMAYFHGHGHIVPGLEEAMDGRSAGDEFTVVVPPAKGYGDRNPAAIQKVHRSNFQPGVEIKVGMVFHAQSAEGHPMEVRVIETVGAQVTIDANHPLAGMTLHFQIKLVEVRDATAEELAHGHAHGPGGHHH